MDPPWVSESKGWTISPCTVTDVMWNCLRLSRHSLEGLREEEEVPAVGR